MAYSSPANKCAGFKFQPLLYQVATGSLSGGEIAAPLRSVLSRQKNTQVLLGQVNDVDPESKRVLLADGASFEYDSLIVATGSESTYYGHESWGECAPNLKSLEEAAIIRDKILYAFEAAERTSDPAERRAWLTFVIAGAGATGVELAGAIGELAREMLKSDFRSIRQGEAQIILIDGAPRILMSFPEDLARKAERSLGKLGVQVKTGAMVKDIDKEGVTVEISNRSDHIAAKTVIWAGGVTAQTLGKTLASRTQAETDKGGKIKVSLHLTLANYPDIYVVGDLALSFNAHGKPLPGLAQVAMQQGTYAAKAIVKKVKGKSEPKPFEYFDKGDLAVIGRGAAVAEIFGIHLSGLMAWLVWVFVHLMYLVQFQSRVLVFAQWAIQYLTFSRGSRLITDETATDFDFNKKLPSHRGTSVDEAP